MGGGRKEEKLEEDGFRREGKGDDSKLQITKEKVVRDVLRWKLR